MSFKMNSVIRSKLIPIDRVDRCLFMSTRPKKLLKKFGFFFPDGEVAHSAGEAGGTDKSVCPVTIGWLRRRVWLVTEEDLAVSEKRRAPVMSKKKPGICWVALWLRPKPVQTEYK